MGPPANRSIPRQAPKFMMKPKFRTRWNLSPHEAMRLQERLRERVILDDQFGTIRTVAGADLAFDPETNWAFGEAAGTGG